MAHTTQQNEKENNVDQPSLDELISVRIASELSGLSQSYIRRLVSQGDIWGMKLGRNWVTTEKAVADYLAQDRQPGRKPKKGS
jgi:excisionase family DNA binding protein